MDDCLTAAVVADQIAIHRFAEFELRAVAANQVMAGEDRHGRAAETAVVVARCECGPETLAAGARFVSDLELPAEAAMVG